MTAPERQLRKRSRKINQGELYMKCAKCEKDVPTDGATYCPFCGKKLINKKLEMGMPLVDILKFLSEEELKATINTLSVLSGSEIKEKLYSPTDPVFVYTPVFSYVWRDGDRRDAEWHKRSERVSVSYIKEAYDSLKNARGLECQFSNIRAIKRKLLATDDPKSVGDYWFKTKDDCERGIRSVIVENGMPITPLMEWF